MAFLAVLTLLISAAPLAFTITPAITSTLTGAELLIVILFALEYGVGWALAPNKSAYVRNPWRLLDAFIIVALVVSLLPLPTDALGLSPALRLIRFARLAVLGTRSSARLAVRGTATVERATQFQGPVDAYALNLDARPLRFDPIDWERVLNRIGSDQDDWLYVSGIGSGHLAPIAERLGVPEPVLRSKLFEAAFPRLDRLERFVTLFAWYPTITSNPETGTATISRIGLLLVGSAQNVAVLAREPCELLSGLARHLEEADPGTPALVNATHALVKEIIRAYARVAEYLETALVRIEAAEATLPDRAFLQRTFRLRGEISRVRTTLRHLTAVTRNLSSRRIAIRGFEVADLPEFKLLASETADLYERVDDLSENLAALVDMRLNVSSFQMNRVMRLLAILTALALIPSVAGGTLGMNLLDSPWPVSLSQVLFWVASGMLLSLYLFSIKGWLR